MSFTTESALCLALEQMRFETARIASNSVWVAHGATEVVVNTGSRS